MNAKNPNPEKQLKQILLEQPFWPLVEEIQAQIAEIVVRYDPEYAGTMALKVAPFYDEAVAWLGRPSLEPRFWGALQLEWPVLPGGRNYPLLGMEQQLKDTRRSSLMTWLRKTHKTARKLRQAQAERNGHGAQAGRKKPKKAARLDALLGSLVLPTQTFLRVEVLDQTAARRLHPNLTIPWRVMDLYLTMSGRSDNLNRLCVEAAAQKLRQAFQRQDQLLCDFGLRGGSDFG